MEPSIFKSNYILKKQGLNLFLAWAIILFTSSATNLYNNHKTKLTQKNKNIIKKANDALYLPKNNVGNRIEIIFLIL